MAIRASRDLCIIMINPEPKPKPNDNDVDADCLPICKRSDRRGAPERKKERTQVGADHIKGNDALNERKCLG